MHRILVGEGDSAVKKHMKNVQHPYLLGVFPTQDQMQACEYISTQSW